MSEERRGTDMVIAFGAGALLGAATALLLAPKSGEDTRRDLSELAEEAVGKGRTLADDVRTKTREGADAASDFLRDQKERVGSALQEGKDAYLRETTKA